MTCSNGSCGPQDKGRLWAGLVAGLRSSVARSARHDGATLGRPLAPVLQSEYRQLRRVYWRLHKRIVKWRGRWRRATGAEREALRVKVEALVAERTEVVQRREEIRQQARLRDMESAYDMTERLARSCDPTSDPLGVWR